MIVWNLTRLYDVLAVVLLSVMNKEILLEDKKNKNPT